jgi:muramoyltetrapeptide carboxypeptidase
VTITHPSIGRPPVVAIVAPSGYAPDAAGVLRADALLAAQGCSVRHYDDPGARHQRFAATDAERLRGLHAAAADPEVDIVLALRGGYGMSRLMAEIDFAALAASGKLFVGHSDFTACSMGLLTHGANSFAGPMICADFARTEVDAFSMTQFWDCLHGPEHLVEFYAESNAPLQLEGMLWGGNLAMLAHLAGSAWMPRVAGGILFLEDINEQPFRVERMLLQLLHAGVLAQQQAIVLGDFSGGCPTAYDNGYDFAAMLAYMRTRIDVPILCGLPFGHVPRKTTLAVGSIATLDSHAGTVSLRMRGYPHLQSR